MRETFPFKKRGDTLSADEVNALSGATSAGVSGREGGGQFGLRGWFTASAADQAHIEQLAVVTSDTVTEDPDDTSDSGRYLVKPRYFDQDTSFWEDDEDGDGIELDVRGFSQAHFDTDRGLFLLVDDVLTVRYDEQRGLMVPVDPPITRHGVANADMEVGAEGEVAIYTDSDTDSGRTVIVKNGWVGVKVLTGDKVKFIYRRELGYYEIISSALIYVAKTPAGGIPARSGTKVGSANCTLYYIDDSDDLQAYLDGNGAQVTVPVKNLSTTAVSGDVYIQMKQEVISGRLMVDWEDC